MNTPELHRPNATFNYYRNDIYWNNFEEIKRHINMKISGNQDIGWQQHLKSKHGHFGAAFFPSCGNGWVERELFSLGIIESAVGLDIGLSMLDTARRTAAEVHMPAQYFAEDINFIDLPLNEYDLVVNHAAMHHVAYINSVSYQLARSLKPDGLYVAFDYVGPHRNQYSWKAWATMIELNATLPQRFQAKLEYPHMKTMLHTDPTEAIHSELQISVMKRYFDFVQYSALGGGVAYQMLYQNGTLFDEQHTLEGRAALKRIMAADEELLKEDPESNLFSFWLAKPKMFVKNLTDDLTQDSLSMQQIKVWQAEEDEREEAAKLTQGRYYPVGALELIYNELADTKYRLLNR